ncbi:hypothetical protein TREMEDRAFT_58455 [Tremella mesenterica DSM 1558]|uniref:uncharacterized protein n=1 Tax=Tremella mesenterica (strain ATCC 24925 / CBS 8224 / DSM 1558 / NBRC 9311 / NRRL Y-6157 / RJB 2259-6 / UBC 559-6) TaxID=578456 RepID=UPI0003F4A068|nr:uncharacterized protein TREMEDRAFT_58455 [Tremella mesenterica DSM 1558]EIW72292.1 hypothetical protein TREMEDRAFT_58455 [Tremella mesenterica DSM 1558]
MSWRVCSHEELVRILHRFEEIEGAYKSKDFAPSIRHIEASWNSLRQFVDRFRGLSDESRTKVYDSRRQGSQQTVKHVLLQLTKIFDLAEESIKTASAAGSDSKTSNQKGLATFHGSLRHMTVKPRPAQFPSNAEIVKQGKELATVVQKYKDTMNGIYDLMHALEMSNTSWAERRPLTWQQAGGYHRNITILANTVKFFLGESSPSQMLKERQLFLTGRLDSNGHPPSYDINEWILEACLRLTVDVDTQLQPSQPKYNYEQKTYLDDWEQSSFKDGIALSPNSWGQVLPTLQQRRRTLLWLDGLLNEIESERATTLLTASQDRFDPTLSTPTQA